jgi:hypothetical protein
MNQEFLSLVLSVTGERMPAVTSALVKLVEHSWPEAEIVDLLRTAEREQNMPTMLRGVLHAFDAAYARFPTAMFWWKDDESHFLGFCPRFAAASGVPALALLGRTDADPAVAWRRQAALYMKDDREVVASGVARFDILERQDRSDGTVWLRTSKVPYVDAHGSGTVGGFDTISSAHAHRLARLRR